MRSAITSFADERVQIISQRVMTTQNLMSLIDRYNLYPDIRESKPREVLLQKMRSDIALKMISADVIDPRSGRPDPGDHRLHGLLPEPLAGSGAEGRERADDAVSQRESHLAHADGGADHRVLRRGDQPSRKRASMSSTRSSPIYKEKHKDSLPDLAQLNVQISDRTELELRDAREPHRGARFAAGAAAGAARAAESDLAGVLRHRPAGHGGRGPAEGAALAARGLQGALCARTTRTSSTPSGRSPASRRKRRPSTRRLRDTTTADTARQLEEAQAQLARAQEKYTPDHPDVVRLTHLVSRARERARRRTVGQGDAGWSQSSADNPVYIQVKGQLDAADGGKAERGGEARRAQGEAR